MPHPKQDHYSGPLTPAREIRRRMTRSNPELSAHRRGVRIRLKRVSAPSRAQVLMNNRGLSRHEISEKVAPTKRRIVAASARRRTRAQTLVNNRGASNHEISEKRTRSQRGRRSI